MTEAQQKETAKALAHMIRGWTDSQIRLDGIGEGAIRIARAALDTKTKGQE